MDKNYKKERVKIINMYGTQFKKLKIKKLNGYPTLLVEFGRLAT